MKYKPGKRGKCRRQVKVYKRKSGGGRFMLSGGSAQRASFSPVETRTENQMLFGLLTALGFSLAGRKGNR